MAEIADVLIRAGNTFGIDPKSQKVLFLDISDLCSIVGVGELSEDYRGTEVLIPLSAPIGELRDTVDGKKFADYKRLVSGIVVTSEIAKGSGLPYEEYKPPSKIEQWRFSRK